MRRILAAVAVTWVAWSCDAKAQVVVVDPSNLIQWGTSIADQVKQYALQTKQYIGEELSWAKQAQQYALQGQQYITEATQLASFVHAPSLGAAMGLLNVAGLGTAMPVSPYAVMGLMHGSSYGAGGIPNVAGLFGTLSQFSGASYSANHIYSPTDGSWNSREMIDRGNAIAGTQGVALASYGDLQAHATAQQAIRTRLMSATTPKDVQDAQAQIELESLWTQNQAASLQSVQITSAAEELARKQRADESLSKGIDDFLSQANSAGRGL